MRQNMRHASGERARAQPLPCSPVADVARASAVGVGRRRVERRLKTPSPSHVAQHRVLRKRIPRNCILDSYQDETTTFTLSPSHLPSTPFFLVCAFACQVCQLSKLKILKLYEDIVAVI